MSSVTSLRPNHLGALLIVFLFAALVSAVEAGWALAVATSWGGQCPLQTNAASCESLVMVVQMLEFLLVVVLIVAAVALFLLIRLYRRTRF